MSNINNKNIFWSEDFSVLYTNNKFLEFLPTIEMSRVEQLNSITRFCIYFFLIACICEKSEIWLQLPIIIIICVYVLYIIFSNDKNGLIDDFIKTSTLTEQTELTEQFENTNGSNQSNQSDLSNNYDIQVGQFDNSDKNINYGGYRSSHDNNKSNKKYTYDKYIEYTKNTCRKPTPDNPFMNPTVNDFDLEFQPEACNVDDEDISDQITNSFNEGLFRDVSDVFEIENSQRQFYTVPNMNPPDTIQFANWLYKSENICKVDQTKCLRYEDIRYNR